MALVGNPNCGKTALFNLLTGARQKVANYSGVTVERKTGLLQLPGGLTAEVIDLPGTYSLHPATPDERVTLDVLQGSMQGEPTPDLVIAVVDATNMRMNLRLVLELKATGVPMVVALNMSDMARSRGMKIDTETLSRELGCAVVETVAVRRDGQEGLIKAISTWIQACGRDGLCSAGPATAPHQAFPDGEEAAGVSSETPVQKEEKRSGSPGALQHEVRRILSTAVGSEPIAPRFQYRLDAVLMHPVWGLAILAALLFLIFQAVFTGAAIPAEAIQTGLDVLSEWVSVHMPAGALRSLLVDGAIAGAGSVLVFLPPILILFFFILLLEDSGYLPRAAFLLDNLMGKVGLSGRAFIPLLSSFACAVPGIMATRTIANWRDRLATIMIAPLMTCSARLPVYALLIGAFVPNRTVGVINLRGLVLFGLYVAGVVSAMVVAWSLKHGWMKSRYQPLMMELPPFRLPSLRNLGLGLWERAVVFVSRVGTIIFSLTVVLWFLATYPAPPAGATGPAIQYTYAGHLGQWLEYVFAPIGFNWQISVALVPGLAAREVAVGALGTVYSLSESGDAAATSLAPIIARSWSMATGLSLLVWYVFAPQCLSTLAVVRRETNSWRYPLIMAAYLFVLAYAASFVTYHLAVMLGGG